MANDDWTQSVHHDGSSYYVVGDGRRLGASVMLRLRADVEAPIKRVFLRSTPNGEQRMQEMKSAGVEAVTRWWEIEMTLHMPRVNYRFFIQAEDGGYWFSANGMTRHSPTDATDFVILANYSAPDWVRDAVFYQIFPDRFYDGDPSNNVHNDEYDHHGRMVVARSWGELPRPHSETGASEFFGGDLQGITQRLPYIEDLGATALYLTPIFTAPSNHKYDVADYFTVDKHFGGNDALVELRQALDARGMRLMLDIVPNHSGSTNKWFLDAQADSASSTAEFYTFYEHPEAYESWFGVKSLPKLNYRSDRLRDYMYAGENAVMRHWLRVPYRIDGWRIDVANMLGRQNETQLGHKVVRGMRRAVKMENPQAYLIGEHFFDGTSHLQGDELDAVMNYHGFTFPVLQWLTPFDARRVWRREWPDRLNISADVMAAQWRAFLAAVPWQIALQQFNLLDSHDIPRVFSHLGEDLALMRLAVALLMTFPGVPCVYYGDEIGMLGASDPDNRRTMIWDEREWNHDLRAWYQALIRLRRQSPALSRGGFQLVYASGNVVAYLREAVEERLLIAGRRAGDAPEALPVRHAGLADGTLLRDALTGREAVVSGGMLDLDMLPSVGAQIWQVVADQ